MICRFSRHGAGRSRPLRDEVPPFLRFQPYQFAHIAGQSRTPSYRTGLMIPAPASIGECGTAIRKLAARVYVRNGAVNIADLVQTGKMVLWQGAKRLRSRAIEPTAAAVKALLESAQREMYDSIDRQTVQLDGMKRKGARETANLGPARAACNITVVGRGDNWRFVRNCCESWGSNLPPGSCQPRPGPLCGLPRHLPFATAPIKASKKPHPFEIAARTAPHKAEKPPEFKPAA